LEGHPEFKIDRIDEVLPEKWRPLIQNGYFKTFPSKNEMDGFFVARLRKES